MHHNWVWSKMDFLYFVIFKFLVNFMTVQNWVIKSYNVINIICLNNILQTKLETAILVKSLIKSFLEKRFLNHQLWKVKTILLKIRIHTKREITANRLCKIQKEWKVFNIRLCSTKRRKCKYQEISKRFKYKV